MKTTAPKPETRTVLSLPTPEMLPPKPGRSRLAVFGGSFNPVHNGHLFLAGEVIRRGLADEVIFVPAGVPPHKPCDGLLPGAVRLELLEEAVKPFPEFSVSDIELQQTNTPSYTITTLDMLRGAFPGKEIVFLMGMDCLAELHTWHRAEELAAQFNFLVYPRPGVAVPKAPELADRFGNRHALKLLASVMDAPLLPVSASQVRTLCAEGKSLAGLVPAGVIRLIGERKLYGGTAAE